MSLNVLRSYLFFLSLVFVLCSGPSRLDGARGPGHVDLFDGTRYVIIHADDLGLSHSTNAAVIEAFKNDAISSGSIMVPCPWFPEIASFAAENTHLDIGVHLTLTSEWKYLKWGSVAPQNEVPSLLDENGFFYATTREFVAHARPEEVEKEIRAQIDRAMAFGVKPTHIDSHMGALFTTPEFFDIYMKVAADYDLPPFVPGRLLGSLYHSDGEHDSSAETDDGQAVDRSVHTFMLQSMNDIQTSWADAYKRMLEQFQPGVNVLIVHLSYDNEEMQAVAAGQVDFGSRWRQEDLDYLMSQAFRDHLQEYGITPTTWRAVHEAYKKSTIR